eukprot:1141000-Pelagomonas_calceolata.AAC.2
MYKGCIAQRMQGEQRETLHKGSASTVQCLCLATAQFILGDLFAHSNRALLGFKTIGWAAARIGKPEDGTRYRKFLANWQTIGQLRRSRDTSCK